MTMREELFELMLAAEAAGDIDAAEIYQSLIDSLDAQEH